MAAPVRQRLKAVRALHDSLSNFNSGAIDPENESYRLYPPAFQQNTLHIPIGVSRSAEIRPSPSAPVAGTSHHKMQHVDAVEITPLFATAVDSFSQSALIDGLQPADVSLCLPAAGDPVSASVCTDAAAPTAMDKTDPSRSGVLDNFFTFLRAVLESDVAHPCTPGVGTVDAREVDCVSSSAWSCTAAAHLPLEVIARVLFCRWKAKGWSSAVPPPPVSCSILPSIASAQLQDFPVEFTSSATDSSVLIAGPPIELMERLSTSLPPAPAAALPSTGTLTVSRLSASVTLIAPSTISKGAKGTTTAHPTTLPAIASSPQSSSFGQQVSMPGGQMQRHGQAQGRLQPSALAASHLQTPTSSPSAPAPPGSTERAMPLDAPDFRLTPPAVVGKGEASCSATTVSAVTPENCPAVSGSSGGTGVAHSRRRLDSKSLLRAAACAPMSMRDSVDSYDDGERSTVSSLSGTTRSVRVPVAAAAALLPGEWGAFRGLGLDHAAYAAVPMAAATDSSVLSAPSVVAPLRQFDAGPSPKSVVGALSLAGRPVNPSPTGARKVASGGSAAIAGAQGICDPPSASVTITSRSGSRSHGASDDDGGGGSSGNEEDDEDSGGEGDGGSRAPSSSSSDEDADLTHHVMFASMRSTAAAAAIASRARAGVSERERAATLRLRAIAKGGGRATASSVGSADGSPTAAASTLGGSPIAASAVHSRVVILPGPHYYAHERVAPRPGVPPAGLGKSGTGAAVSRTATTTYRRTGCSNGALPLPADDDSASASASDYSGMPGMQRSRLVGRDASSASMGGGRIEHVSPAATASSSQSSPVLVSSSSKRGWERTPPVPGPSQLEARPRVVPAESMPAQPTEFSTAADVSAPPVEHLWDTPPIARSDPLSGSWAGAMLGTGTVGARNNMAQCPPPPPPQSQSRFLSLLPSGEQPHSSAPPPPAAGPTLAWPPPLVLAPGTSQARLAAFGSSIGANVPSIAAPGGAPAAIGNAWDSSADVSDAEIDACFASTGPTAEALRRLHNTPATSLQQ